MLMKDPEERPTAKKVLTLLEGMINKSATEMKLMKPEVHGEIMGMTTTIFTEQGFVEPKGWYATGETREEYKSLKSESAVNIAA